MNETPPTIQNGVQAVRIGQLFQDAPAMSAVPAHVSAGMFLAVAHGLAALGLHTDASIVLGLWHVRSDDVDGASRS